MNGARGAHPWEGLLRGTVVHPERPFFVGERPLSYARAAARVDAYAATLAARGLRRGDRIVIAASDGAEAVLLALAALRLGVVFAPLLPQIGVRTFRWALADSGPALVALDLATSHLASEFDPGLLLLLDGRQGEGAEVPSGDPGANLGDGELAALLYTSGTTGRPRGVMISHGNLRFTTRAIQRLLGYRGSDVIGVFLPLSFDYGLYQVFLALEAGAALYLGDPSESGPGMVKALARHRVSVLPATPRLVAGLLQLLEHRARPLPALRLLTNTGDRLPAAHAERLRRVLPRLSIALMYGQTECKRISILPCRELEAHPASVGRPLPGTEAFVASETGERLPAGEIGELRVRGPHLTQGYWRAGAETAAHFLPSPEGCGARELATGDLCCIDAEGFLYFAGRRNGWLKHQGFRVDPREVEDAALEVPGVGAAALVQAARSDRLHLFVANAARSAPPAVLNHLRRELEPFKLPDEIHWLAELPTTANGKVDRRLLGQLAEGAPA